MLVDRSEAVGALSPAPCPPCPRSPFCQPYAMNSLYPRCASCGRVSSTSGKSNVGEGQISRKNLNTM